MPTLGHWKTRTCGQSIRYLLAYADEIYTEQPFKGREDWLKVMFGLGLAFPSLPFYYDEHVKLSRSSTILKYLGGKYELDGKNDEERLRVQILADRMVELNSQWEEMCFDKEFELRKPNYFLQFHNDMMSVSDFLGNRTYFAGETLTFVDFAMFEFLSQHMILKSNCLDPYRNIKRFKESIENLPRVRDFIRTSPTMRYPLHQPGGFFGSE